MSQHTGRKSNAPIRFLFEYSGFLIAGTVIALVWANLDPDTPQRRGSYNRFVHARLIGGDESTSDHHGPSPREAPTGGTAGEEQAHPEPDQADSRHGAPEASTEKTGIVREIVTRVIHRPDPLTGTRHGITVHFLINDILMALFFAIAGKEVWESMLPGGPLANPRKAATPLLATFGGIVGPAAVYLSGTWITGSYNELGQGWAIPCATDIAFSYLVARLVFGPGHPAIAFLLLLAIADDAAGLVILAVCYPSKPIEPEWFLLTVAAIALAFGFRRLRLHSFWWYLLIPGVLSWISFDLAGIHAALGLVPIIPCMPHAHTDLGIYAREELKRHDTLNEFEHGFKYPVEVILGLFGLANAGVVFSAMGTGTWLVLLGLLIGKPVGITLFTWLAEKVLKLEVPKGMTYAHIISLGMIAGLGFTVALFVSSAAFRPGPIQDAVKMGALFSFAAALIAPPLARLLGVRPTGADI